jgi:hypothetical protein
MYKTFVSNFIKTSLATVFTFLLLCSFSHAQSSLQYEMVSYTANAQNRAQTPFLNLAFFNQPTFTINYQSFSNGFQFIFDLVIGISIATAVILFMVAAFSQIINAGNIKDIQQGRKGMVNAIVGLMIVLSTWLVINTINPDLIRLPIFQGLDSLANTSQTQKDNNSSVQLDSN